MGQQIKILIIKQLDLVKVKHIQLNNQIIKNYH